MAIATDYRVTPTHIHIGKYSVPIQEVRDLELHINPRFAFYHYPVPSVRLWTEGAMGHPGPVLFDIQLRTAEKVVELAQQILKTRKNSFRLSPISIEPKVEPSEEGQWRGQISWRFPPWSLSSDPVDTLKKVVQPVLFPQFGWRDDTTLEIIRPNREAAVQAIKDALEPCLARMYEKGYSALKFVDPEFETLKKETLLPKRTNPSEELPLYLISETDVRKNGRLLPSLDSFDIAERRRVFRSHCETVLQVTPRFKDLIHSALSELDRLPIHTELDGELFLTPFVTRLQSTLNAAITPEENEAMNISLLKKDWERFQSECKILKRVAPRLEDLIRSALFELNALELQRNRFYSILSQWHPHLLAQLNREEKAAYRRDLQAIDEQSKPAEKT